MYIYIYIPTWKNDESIKPNLICTPGQHAIMQVCRLEIEGQSCILQTILLSLHIIKVLKLFQY